MKVVHTWSGRLTPICPGLESTNDFSSFLVRKMRTLLCSVLTSAAHTHSLLLCTRTLNPIGMDQTLCLEAINLLVVLLAERGGNVTVQTFIFKYLKDTDSTLFFTHIKEILAEIFSWFQKEVCMYACVCVDPLSLQYMITLTHALTPLHKYRLTTQPLSTGTMRLS